MLLRAFHWIRVYFMLHFFLLLPLLINRCSVAVAVLFRFSFGLFFRAFWFSLLVSRLVQFFYAIFTYMRLDSTFASSFLFSPALYWFLYFFLFVLGSLLYSWFLLLISSLLFVFTVRRSHRRYSCILTDTQTHGPLGGNPILFYHVFGRLLLLLSLILFLFITKNSRFTHNLHLYDAL